MTFRKDINGLRAIAVLAVVLFHFRIAGFDGGFSGVDVFFVISGYLMTGIIFTKINKNQFSIIGFYIQRARRIIPALAVLCLFIIGFGYLYFVTPEYREVMQNVRKVILFVSNHAFYEQSGYFDTSSQENWLLHTWSLSVEWQFYLAYPIFVVLCRKFTTESATKLLLIAAFILSLTFSIIYTPINPSGAFYFLPSRAWEMLAGGLVFLFPLKLTELTKKVLEILGISLILIGIFCLNDSMLWPGYLALIPVAGVLLTIAANKSSLLTSNIAFQGLGKISYSVYLWHWPIVVFLHICGLLNQIVYVIIGIALSLFMGTLSYFFVEKRFSLKRSYPIEIARYSCIIVLVIGIAAVMGSLVKHNSKIRQNFLFSESFQTVDKIIQKKYGNATRDCLFGHDRPTFPECKFGEGEPTIIVLGDSHAGTTFSAVQEANDQGASILWAHMACPIIDGVKFVASRGKKGGCLHLISEKLSLLKTSYPDVPVLFINYLNPYFKAKTPAIYFSEVPKDMDDFRIQYQQAYVKSLCEIAKQRPVYVLKPIPEPGVNVPKKMASLLMLSSDTPTVTSPLSTYQKDNLEVIKSMEEAYKTCGVQLLDPTPYYCTDGKNCEATEGDNPLYFDDHHLTDYGNKRLVPLFKKIFEKTQTPSVPN